MSSRDAERNPALRRTWRASSSTASSVYGSGSRSLKYSPPAWPQQACSDTSAGSKRRDGALHAREMLAIDAVGGAQAKADAVQAERVVSAGALERAHRGAAFVKIVLGVRFDPADGRALGGERVVMERTRRPIPARAGIGPAAHLVIRGATSVVTSAFLSAHLAAHLLALAFRHVLPVVRRLVWPLAWPAQECLAVAQSFLPASATPRHFSLAGRPRRRRWRCRAPAGCRRRMQWRWSSDS